MLTKRIKMQGFIIFDDYLHRYNEFFGQMCNWLKEGKIKFREDIVDGLENAPQAFIGLLEGKNFGKIPVPDGRFRVSAAVVLCSIPYRLYPILPLHFF
ncbi:MAG: hypothetical protein PHD43_23495 [Methylococcales bacterium]|nr:hypothetical protein [Methylococcales bacterium]